MEPDASDPRAVVVRPATSDDAAAVADVWRIAWHDGHRGHVPDALLAARDPAYFDTRARALLDHIAVAADGEELLGVVITRGDELQQIMVSASARGRGVGALLLMEAERRVEAAGYSEIWLAVVPGNTVARRFYEERGWVDRGEETYDSVTLSGGTVPVPVRRYVKRLRGSGSPSSPR